MGTWVNEFYSPIFFLESMPETETMLAAVDFFWIKKVDFWLLFNKIYLSLYLSWTLQTSGMLLSRPSKFEKNLDNTHNNKPNVDTPTRLTDPRGDIRITLIQSFMVVW